ncbi:ComF family protein [Ligilactobacillus sp. LYQ60]|uniref:ComF family protein n=1 Tax=unclassified Ligilactobacillus TaxID=2767920 RepID=UPI0038553839
MLSWQRIQDDYLCSACRKEFVRLTGSTCPGCGRKWPELCPDCRRWRTQQPSLLCNRALYAYNNAMRTYMQRYKFQGDYRLRRVFSDELQTALTKWYPRWQGWIYVPLPVDDITWQTRGFNQVVGFLSGIAIKEGLMMIPSCHQKQSTKTRTARLQTKQPFQAKPSAARFARVVLVDDVYTTGRTLYHARKALTAVGVQHIRSVTLAR